MPSRCVVGDCSNNPNSEEGITLHIIPYFGDDRPLAKSRRKRWIQFVKTKRSKWSPSASSAVWSRRFLPTNYIDRNNVGNKRKSHLMRDETGIVPVPTIHVGEQDENIEEQMLSNRSRRTILRAINTSVRCDENSQQGHVHEESEGININNSDFHTCSSANNVPCSQESVDEPMQKDVYTQTKNCVECSKLKEENRQLRNKCIDLKETQQDLMKQKTSIGVQCDMYYEKLVSGVSDHEMEEQVEYEREEYEGMDVHVEAESSFMSDDDDDDDDEASGADAPYQGDTEADDPQELNEMLNMSFVVIILLMYIYTCS
ncbi:hypothetical protein QZH41_002996 [Actinostola sp. cb2023]|nr:hypothetical protein QZH41_002996 [Actinostola sp. cb2023]